MKRLALVMSLGLTVLMGNTCRTGASSTGSGGTTDNWAAACGIVVDWDQCLKPLNGQAVSPTFDRAKKVAECTPLAKAACTDAEVKETGNFFS